MSAKPLSYIKDLISRRQKTPVGMGEVTLLTARFTRVQSFRQALPEFGREFARARRNQHCLAVVVISVPEQAIVAENLETFSKCRNGNGEAHLHFEVKNAHLLFFLSGWILRDVLRENDIVSYDAASGRYIVLLAESERLQAVQVSRRISELLFKRLLIQVRAGIAVFPIDGFTLEGLLGSAEADSHSALTTGLTPLCEAGASDNTAKWARTDRSSEISPFDGAASDAKEMR